MNSPGVLKQEADSMLRRATEAGDIPGVAAMACTRDATLYEGAFGTRKLGVNKPMAIDSVVWIASMTKPITSAGVMQLVEQGRIGLDDAMRRWVPELAAVQVLEGFDVTGSPRLRAPKRPITLRHLLTHTSGYGYGLWNEPITLYAETVELMSRNHMGELRVAPLRTVNPLRSNDAEFFPGVPKSWGLGFMINHDKAPTGRSRGSLAWAGLSNCYFWIDPAAGIGGVYMTQILPFADVKSLPLFLDFETAVYRSLS